MKWSNLKIYGCPKCAFGLRAENDVHYCENKECNFFISKGKFDDIVQRMYGSKRNIMMPKDNFEALQNLGHKEVTEDFEDSPYADRE